MLTEWVRSLRCVAAHAVHAHTRVYPNMSLRITDNMNPTDDDVREWGYDEDLSLMEQDEDLFCMGLRTCPSCSNSREIRLARSADMRFPFSGSSFASRPSAREPPT